ncbi:substrate-binding domain-containing protein [Actinomadura syzygii]|uniref:VWA domain-containing protein n=1 Tax=Actinomadura syzygii TaxID=1427538 RepID=A0A5D0TQI7_9ACTN|nr:substrate-binding domain-containing protein [Actinomadura syzygii]TYC07670.1 VWA domain-containing protein [Actinomadura syzygii]
MNGRSPRRRLVPILAAAAGVLVLTGVGAYAFAEIAGCASEDRITLDVAVAPELLPGLDGAARRFERSTGTCARVRLQGVDPAAVSASLSGRDEEARPDVWIPDSTFWTAFAKPSYTGGSVARSPIVLATAAPTDPSWKLLLGPAAAAVSERPPTGPAGPVPQVPDPTRSAVGLAALLMADRLLAVVPDGRAVFTGLVRAARETTAPTVDEALGSKDAVEGGAVVVASEQAVFEHNRRGLGPRAYGDVPNEGTLSLDYPFAIVTRDRGRVSAAKRLERVLLARETREDVRRLGFDPDDQEGVRPPGTADVRRVAEAYARLALPTRLLVLFDVSGSMAERVAPGLDRLQATAHVGQAGLQLLADDSELGVWEFSTRLRGSRDWAERVPIAPLGDRVGSVTQRQRILSDLGALRVRRDGDTGLYESLLAAFREMKRGYKPEMVNTVLVFTDGRNDDEGGPSFAQTLADLDAEYDPTQPVQVILQGFGEDVDVNLLTRLAEATHGVVQVARTPQESRRLLLEAMSRRVCTPNC